jgi:hypothetical protein
MATGSLKFNLTLKFPTFFISKGKLTHDIDSAEKASVHPSSSLRTNGETIETIENFSVHAELVEVFLGFFSRIDTLTICWGVGERLARQADD